MNENESGKKSSSGRKKMIDLKAVDIDENNVHPFPNKSGGKDPLASYKPNEELISQASRIKYQRDLIQTRIQKMATNRAKVSKSVFDKVYRDYMMQLESVTRLLNEKKGSLKKVLEDLYMLREQHQIEAARHKEILEEAHFRQFLDEFSEEQFKEVEEYETREITNLERELAQMNSYIKVHEELFDPQDLQMRQSTAEVTKTYHPLGETGSHTSTVTVQKNSDQYISWEQKQKMNQAKAFNIPVVDKTDPGLNLKNLASQGDYFGSNIDLEPEMPEEKPIQKKIQEKKEEQTPLTKESKAASHEDSILDLLDDLPAPEGSETHSQISPPQAPVVSEAPPSAVKPGVKGHKLIFIETDGDFNQKEFVLKDNISIGRSPSNDLVFQAPKVSRQHAAINKYKDQYIIIDLKSSNGVYVNGKKVEEHNLKEGDAISIGGFKMIFQKN